MKVKELIKLSRMKNIFILIILLLVGCNPRVEIQYEYQIGDIVYYKTDTNKIGIVTSVSTNLRGEPYYCVRFSTSTYGFDTLSKSMFEAINVFGFEIEKK